MVNEESAIGAIYNSGKEKKIVEDTGSHYRIDGDDFWYVRVFGPGPDMPMINIGPGPHPDPTVIGPGTVPLEEEKFGSKFLERLKELSHRLDGIVF
jgi:hypothetical protein